MLLYYTKLAWRNLAANKFFSMLNIAGLALGLAACIAVYLFVKDENSYDRQNKDADRIYRITSKIVGDDGSETVLPVTPPAMAVAIQRQLPEAEQVVRLFPPSSAWGSRFYVRTANKKFYEENIYRADASIFDVFTIQFQSGSPASALKDVNSIVLTSSIAKRYFGEENPIGKIIEIDNWDPYVVSAVIKDFPENVHFKIDMIVSLQSLNENNRLSSHWGWNSFYTYVKLRKNASYELFTKKIAELYKAHNPDNKSSVGSQPLTGIHLHSNLTGELKPNSDPLYSYIFVTISILILLSTCINYINLSTARAAVRSKEIGMRKISGANMSGLLLQFLTEAMLSAFIAAFLALLIVWLLLPVINTITGKQLNMWQDNFIIPGTLFLSMITGMMAGFYPAIHLSLFKPIVAVRNQTIKAGKSSGISLRRLLVITQFSISASLITGLIIVNQQLHYMQQGKLGLDKEHLIIVNDIGYLDEGSTTLLKDEWLKINGVEKVAAADGVPGGYNWARNVTSKNINNKQMVNFLSIDNDFIPAFDMQIADGRNFSLQNGSDSTDKIILNETAVKKLNIPSPVIGQQIVWNQNQRTGETSYATICGVVKDFHYSSMKNEIQPFVFVRRNNRKWIYAIKLSGNNLNTSISAIKKIWDKNIHSRPFQFTFLDETYAKLYASEMNFNKIFTCISFVAILIACMGLFGLSMFMTRQRTKEISIRKIIGASGRSILILLSKDFIRLILIAAFISLPIAWWAVATWLRSYAYHVAINWYAFFAADLFVMVAALITICFHVAKAVLSNPLQLLKTE